MLSSPPFSEPLIQNLNRPPPTRLNLPPSPNPTLICFPSPVEDIKSKFKNLRTTFQRQHKAVKASEVCGPDVFVPQWKYYQQLMFLQAAGGLDDCKNAPLRSSLIVSQEESEHVLTSPGLIISILPPESSRQTTTTTSSPSYILSNMVAKSLWTEEKERALIDFYAGKSTRFIVKQHRREKLPTSLQMSLG